MAENRPVLGFVRTVRRYEAICYRLGCNWRSPSARRSPEVAMEDLQAHENIMHEDDPVEKCPGCGNEFRAEGCFVGVGGGTAWCQVKRRHVNRKSEG